MQNLIALSIQNQHVAQSIVCRKNADVTDVYLKGIIHAKYGVSATDLRNAFDQAAGADVSMHINSPGGDVFEGREMQAVIAGYPGKITAIIEGVAASAATIVALSCAEVQMLKGSRFMIHNGMTIAAGNKSAMQAAFTLLEGFDVELAAEYAEKTKGTTEQMTAWMDAETWFTSEAALEAGFVHKVLPNSQGVSNEWNLSAYKAPPADASPPILPEPIQNITPEHRERQQQRMKLVNHATRQ